MGKVVRRCPTCGASPCYQRNAIRGAVAAPTSVANINSALPADSLAVVMAEHPDLPVLVLHGEDEPPCFVVQLTGVGTVGEYALYADRYWDDADELAWEMHDNGICGDKDEAASVAKAMMRPCIWAHWTWANLGAV